MSLAHLTLPTPDVEQTASFLEQTLGYSRDPTPANSPVATVWLNTGRGQQLHITYVEGFRVSPFEGEFGRHLAVYYPLAQFGRLKTQLERQGAQLLDEMRPAPFERFFFREPVNGYVFEVIDQARVGRPEGQDA